MGGSSVAERNLDRFTVAVGLVWSAAIVGLGLIERFSSRLTARRPAPCGRPPSLTYQGDTVASGNAIRGSRVGAGPMGEAERGDAAARVFISYWCANGHETRPSFAEEAGPASPRRGTARGAASPPARTSRTRRPPRGSSRTRRTWPT